MLNRQKQPYKTYRVGGKSFCIYLEYDEQLQESYLAYPNFQENPEYTHENRPFATAEQESCSYGKSKVCGGPQPYDCGGCGWFYRELTPYDPIGICMCDLRRKNE